MAPLIGAQAASAQPYPPSSPPLSVSTTTVTAGEQLSFSTIPGVFEPGSHVTAVLQSKPVVLGHFRARADGSVAGTVTIPGNTVTGWHVFRLTSKRPHQNVGVSIYVLGRMTPTPTPKPPHHPGKPGHHHGPQDAEHHGNGGGLSASHELPSSVEPSNSPHPDRNGKGLAATGSEQALVVGGTATALLMAGGGTMLAVRRRRSS
ncbi:hypothetical protein PYK79_23810 [Streptomyces sp. ID05-04B]|uniref:hypothetical protein n=1 Tax=unclassified Streptomyces TaxID=2593676 RepID=UPI00131F02B9|nr:MULTISPECIES: hypothetical protein [unclassified Streptomyces]MDX5565731.1 hypothetical protein [Streptomyces sp. ID05-04B]